MASKSPLLVLGLLDGVSRYIASSGMESAVWEEPWFLFRIRPCGPVYIEERLGRTLPPVVSFWQEA